VRFEFLCKFPILRRIERNIIINAYRGLHVKYQFFLPVLNQTYIFPTYFEKFSNVKVFHADGRTGSHDEESLFTILRKAPIKQSTHKFG
jgi:hypothetical protein